MTLIVAVVTPNYAVVASDRRLTTLNGNITDDESCKMTAFACFDAKVIVAYTGVAQCIGHSTDTWILNSLSELARSCKSIYEHLHGFCDIANKKEQEFLRLGLTFKLEVIFAGYVFANGLSYPNIWKVSNLYHQKFEVITSGSDNSIFVEFAGDSSGVINSNKQKIEWMLVNGKTAYALEMKLHHTIIEASLNRKSGGRVGSQINTCILRPEKNSPFIGTYYSNKTTNMVFGLNAVFATTDEGAALLQHGAQLIAGSDNPPAVVPKVRPTRPCKCGSGLQYKECHKKIKYPYFPLFTEIELKNYVLESGTFFRAISYGAAAKR